MDGYSRWLNYTTDREALKVFIDFSSIWNIFGGDMILENEKNTTNRDVPAKHKTTKKRLLEFYGEDFSQKSEPQEEIDWGDPVGMELW